MKSEMSMAVKVSHWCPFCTFTFKQCISTEWEHFYLWCNHCTLQKHHTGVFFSFCWKHMTVIKIKVRDESHEKEKPRNLFNVVLETAKCVLYIFGLNCAGSAASIKMFLEKRSNLFVLLLWKLVLRLGTRKRLRLMKSTRSDFIHPTDWETLSLARN